MRTRPWPWLIALIAVAVPVAATGGDPPALRLADAAFATPADDGLVPAWPADGGDVTTVPPGARPAAATLPAVTTVRDDVVLRTAAGDERLTRGEDRFFDPQLSPDGHAVVFVGLTTGVHVLRLQDRRLTHPGPGTAPVWTPDSRWVLFERTTDDGARLTGSELIAHRPADDTTVALTDTPGAHERRPAVSPDGTRVAYLRDGAVWVARLVEEPR